MTELLPVGTIVDVTEPAITYTNTDWWGNQTTETDEPRRYRGRIEGYDMHGTKYHLAHEIAPGRFTSKPISWAFPSYCVPVTEPGDPA